MEADNNWGKGFGCSAELRGIEHVVLIRNIANVAKAVALSAGLIAFASSAQAEFQISTYNGYGYNLEADFAIQQPNGTDMVLHDVGSEDHKSLTWDGGPMYYGVRLLYWMQDNPNWGFSVDYTHLKVAPDLNDVVQVSGTRDNVPIGGSEAINQTVSKLEYTDGLNLLTFNAMYRFAPDAKWNPYVGVGVGLSIPHVEFRRTGSSVQTFEYQVAGVAVQMLAGMEYRFWDNVSAFAEYKLTYAEVEGDLVDGGTLESEHWTNHFILGMTYRFGDRGGDLLK